MKRLTGFAVVSAFYAAIAYLVTDSWLYGLVALFVSAVLFAALEFLVLKGATERIRKKKEATFFTRSFILSLLATGSLNEAYKSALGDAPKGLLKIVSEVEKRSDPSLALSSLKDYFQEDFYLLFLSVVRMAVEEGGDLTLLCESFLAEADERERDEIRRDGAKKKALGEFISLSFLGSLILAFLRFSLSGFYKTVSGNSLYTGIALLYVLFAIGTVIWFALTYFEVRSKDLSLGVHKHEKTKKQAQKAD